MKKFFKYSFVLVILIAVLGSCTESRKRATEQLNELSEQADEINAAVDDGLKKIESFDSVIQTGAEQIKEYDSVIKNSTLKIDSITKQKSEALQELISF